MDYYKQEEYYSRIYHAAEIRLSRWNEVAITLSMNYLLARDCSKQSHSVHLWTVEKQVPIFRGIASS